LIARKFIIFASLSGFLVSFFCGVKAFSVSEYDEIEVLKSDQEGVVFKYSVPEPTFANARMNGIDFDQISLDKCVLSDSPEEPQLPVRIVVIGVPPETEIEVEILEGESQERPEINLTSPPKIEQSDKSRLGYQVSYQKLDRVFMVDRFFPEKIVSFDPPIFLRNQRIVRLRIYPVQYNPQRKTIRYYPQLTISVRFLGRRTETRPGKEPQRIEKDLFEKIYQNVLLNYEESKIWRKTEERGGFFKQTLAPLGKPEVVYPFGYSENWYKMVVRENGIYKIDRAMLIQAGVPVSEIDPRTFRIFSGGGKTLPLENSNPFLELSELSIFVSGERDGKFDSDDFILFYGWSVNDWDYDSTGEKASFYTNPFTYDNIFWLTFGGETSFPQPPKRMEIKNGDLREPDSFLSYKFKSRVHVEQDREQENYRDWYWFKTASVRMFLSLPGAVPNDSNLLKVRTTSVGKVDIRVNQKPAKIIDSLSSYTLRVASTSAFHGGIIDTLDFSLSDTVFLDYYEVEYWRKFECHDRQLLFESPEAGGVVQYEISNLVSSQVLVFDVTDKFEVKMFDTIKIEGEYAKFQDSVEADFKTRYYLVDQGKLKKPVKLFSDEGSDLRNRNNQADFLIITYSDFYDQVQSLKSWRASFNQMLVKTIKVEDIYDEFSGGLFDPVAIRDFLKYAYQEWQKPAPAFVLLVGDGNYDFKNNLGTGVPNFIPPFTLDPSISDDMYVLFGNTLGMIISRVPVRSENEAEVVVNKIIGYESEPEFGTWRNLITLVADDEWYKDKGGIVIDGLWRSHTPDTENLAKFHVPSSFNINKIYLMEYPFDQNGGKSQAEEAIVNNFNSGSLIVNYIGHANPDVWSNEWVFKAAQDIPRLNNKKKLPLVYMATCLTGFFFSPYTEGMAEELLRAEGKGAIATISAVLKVTAEPNVALNYKVYDLLLYDSLSVGEALFIAKVDGKLNDNDREYALFGDPVMRLGMPGLEVKLTQVTPDTLSALSLVSIKGEVRERGGDLSTNFNGKAYILGFDSQRKNVHEIKDTDGTHKGNVSYDLPGLVIFRGEALVEDGRFDANFVVPKDISYGGNTGRVSVYVFNENQDGAGAKDSLVILGSDTTVVDTTGPEVTISFEENPNFLEGDVIPPSATLHLSISDEHGINITGELGHGITLVIDQDYQHEFDLTKNFQYDLGSFQKGGLSYQLSNLSEGGHVLSIKAWDNANNSSLVSVRVEVRAQMEFELTQVMNYPNPFSKETNFYYHLSSSAERVEIEIFTLAGRLIKHLPNASKEVGINFSTTWDGKDQDGDQVANGVYIYKVTAEGRIDGEAKKKEVFGKAVVLR
jgi:hypothetical protein